MNSRDKNFKYSKLVNKLTICLKNNKKTIDINMPEQKLKLKELFTANIKDLRIFLPKEKPITPSVEKAYESNKKDEIIMFFRE